MISTRFASVVGVGVELGPDRVALAGARVDHTTGERLRRLRARSAERRQLAAPQRPPALSRPGHLDDEHRARAEAVGAVHVGRVDRHAVLVARHRAPGRLSRRPVSRALVALGKRVVRPRVEADGRIGEVAALGRLGALRLAAAGMSRCSEQRERPASPLLIGGDPTSDRAPVTVAPMDLVAADRAHLWHPFTQQRGWIEEDAAGRRPRRGHRPDRRRGPALHRRRLVALVQRARPPPPAHRRRRARPARPRRALHDARPQPPAGHRAGAAPGRARAGRAHARLLLRLRLDRHRDRAQDGVPVLAAARRGAAHEVRRAADGLPRRHDRLGLGRRHRPVPLALPPAAVRHAQGRARRRGRAWSGCSPSTRARWRR